MNWNPLTKIPGVDYENLCLSLDRDSKTFAEGGVHISEELVNMMPSLEFPDFAKIGDGDIQKSLDAISIYTCNTLILSYYFHKMIVKASNEYQVFVDKSTGDVAKYVKRQEAMALATKAKREKVTKKSSTTTVESSKPKKAKVTKKPITPEPSSEEESESHATSDECTSEDEVSPSPPPKRKRRAPVPPPESSDEESESSSLEKTPPKPKRAPSKSKAPVKPATKSASKTRARK